MAKRVESSHSGLANALSPLLRDQLQHCRPTLIHQGSHPSSHAVNNHHGTHLAPPPPPLGTCTPFPLERCAWECTSSPYAAVHDLSQPSPQASGTSASMHSTPSPPTPRPGVGAAAISTAELWEIVQKSQSGQRRLSEGQVQLSPSVLKSLFPLTWARCQAGSGATFDGVYAVGVNEGHTVDIKACMQEPPPHMYTVASSSSALTPPSSSAPSSSASGSKTTKREEEQEEGEAEEDDPPPPAPAADDEDLSRPDMYRDHDGARWCWPFTSGDHVVHVVRSGQEFDLGIG